MPAGWLPVEEDLGPAFDAVEPDVAEGDPLLVLLHRALLSEELELMTGQRAGVGADVEDVTEVRLDQERALDVDRIPAAILDADPLVQAAVDEAAAPDAQALLRNPALAFVHDQHRVYHLECGHVALVDGRREQDRLQAVQPKFVG